MKTRYQNTSYYGEKITVNVMDVMYHGCRQRFVTVKYADLYYMYNSDNCFTVRDNFDMLNIKTYDWLMSVFSELFSFYF